ncbi:MobC family plasmid mobilization relaxosome protein [Geobacter sulfurreducens]|uniref:MobC family plasmid mobilization relaxosome protein n=1 Tax=Geobacter sulfurreducens TaxID=35554 RepID=UPI0020B8DD20|nr:MobC family plasmid mobilization relaxosome protein [Geobacter sulfurreducens]UTG93166.1 plasmid mobilization relaxosome protein MobC [Geobacter sulfurreducens]
MKSHDNRKSKPGRPNVAASKVRKNILPVRLSDEDLLALHEKSQRVGVSFSTFLREAGLGRELPRPVPKLNLDTYMELSRIGRNLNQLVKSIHEGKVQFLLSAYAETVNELAAIIPLIRKEVKGK